MLRSRASTRAEIELMLARASLIGRICSHGIDLRPDRARAQAGLPATRPNRSSAAICPARTPVVMTLGDTTRLMIRAATDHRRGEADRVRSRPTCAKWSRATDHGVDRRVEARSGCALGWGSPSLALALHHGYMSLACRPSRQCPISETKTDATLRSIDFPYSIETRPCQTLAWLPNASYPSASHQLAPSTTGMTTTGSPTCAVKPPSRPTMPRIVAPRSRANSRAWTRLGLTLRSIAAAYGKHQQRMFN